MPCDFEGAYARGTRPILSVSLEGWRLVYIQWGRWNKPYLECIRKQGGFSWFFKTQIFPYGQEKSTRQLFTRLSAGPHRQFPVSVRNSLPERTVRIFNEWVRLSEDNPPEINTAYRCKKPPRA